MIRGILALLLAAAALAAPPVGAAPGTPELQTYRFIGRAPTLDVDIRTSAPDTDEPAFVAMAVYVHVDRFSFPIGAGFDDFENGLGAQLPCDLPECHVAIEQRSGEYRLRATGLPRSLTTEWVIAVRGIGTKVTNRTKGWTVRRNDVAVHHRVSTDTLGGARVRLPDGEAAEVFRGVPAVPTKRRSVAFAQLPCEHSGQGSANLVNRTLDYQAVLICLGKTSVVGVQEFAGPSTWELTGQVLAGVTSTRTRLVVLDVP